MDFRQVAFYGVAAALVAVVLHFLIAGRKAWPGGAGPKTPARTLRFLEALVYLAALSGFLALASSGFYSAIALNARMTGFILLVHVSAGGLFAVSLAALVVFRAEASRFGAREADAGPERFRCGQKVLFWGIALLGLTALSSILLSMVPFFGTSGQANLYALHRCCAVGLLMAAIGYGYFGLLPCACGHAK